MKVDSASSFNKLKSYIGDDGVTYTDPSFWRYGFEHWCNLEGQYVSIVADLSHLAG